MSGSRLDQLTDFTFAFTGGPAYYLGPEVHLVGASDSSESSESAGGVRVALRAASTPQVSYSTQYGIGRGTIKATGSDTATSSEEAEGVLGVKNGEGSDSAESSEEAFGVRVVLRAGEDSASSSETSGAEKLFIFRPPVGDTFPWVYRDTPVPGYNLLARLAPGQRARNIYKLTDGTFTNNQPAEVSDYVAIYLGAHNNFVSAAEKADLIAAGYGEYVT